MLDQLGFNKVTSPTYSIWSHGACDLARLARPKRFTVREWREFPPFQVAIAIEAATISKLKLDLELHAARALNTFKATKLKWSMAEWFPHLPSLRRGGGRGGGVLVLVLGSQAQPLVVHASARTAGWAADWRQNCGWLHRFRARQWRASRCCDFSFTLAKKGRHMLTKLELIGKELQVMCHKYKVNINK